jgi:rifampicin phosphotransferase
LSEHTEERRAGVTMVPADGGYLLNLAEITRLDAGEAGGKASTLGELLKAGFPVPEGYVLTTGAFDRFVQANGLGDDPSPEEVLSGKIPQDVKKAILDLSARFGDALLAVRSSGVSEDLADASFAGQYETVLGVKGRDELEEAIMRCWASAFSARVESYRSSTGGEHVRRMAVLVQRLVRAEAAGVAFTANPVTGDRSEVVINSVKGLGERLVSGTSTPDEWVVKGGKASCVASVEDAINAKLALEIADLGGRVEAQIGSPQDLEWAFSDGKLYLIQARPITSHVVGKKEQVVPVPIAIEAPEGFWLREEASFAHPVSPMEISLWNPFMREMSQRYTNEFGLPFEGMDFRSIGGYVYLRLIPLGGKERSPPPSWLMPLLVRLVPQVRSMNKKCVQAVRANRQEQVVDSWYNESRPSFKKRIHDLLNIDLSSLNDDDLGKQIGAAVSLYYEASEVHFRLVFSISLPMGRFFAFCRTHLGWSDNKIVLMLSGLNEVSVEPSRGLAELAGAAAGNPAIMKLLATKGDEEILGNLEKVDPAFASALSEYLEQYGHRALSYEVSAPTMAEDPAIIIGLIRQRARAGRSSAYLSSVEAVTKRRQDAIAEARKILGARGAMERERFERLLKDAERAHPTLEDSEFYSMECRGLVRDRLLELGRRLTKRGLVDSPEDVFFFGIDEVEDILQEGRRRPASAGEGAKG